MGAEPAVFGAFYRRFEDEVLAYFLARGAAPEVAADLTAETFAAALPSRRWKRLADKARSVLEVSCGEGRVAVEARRRRHMSPLVLTDDAVARIAAIDRNKFAHVRVLHTDEQDDLQVRVIDESGFDQLATNLQLSDCVVRRGATEPDAHHGERARIPELEDNLVAAAARVPMRSRGAPVAVAGLAVAGLAFVVLTQGDGGGPGHDNGARQDRGAGQDRGRIDHEAKIVRAGNAWARFFAASTRHCVEHMTPPACEQVLSARFKRSFRNATVRDVLVIRGHRAAAKFSNGEVVAFRYIEDGGGQWSVDRLGPEAGRGLLPG